MRIGYGYDVHKLSDTGGKLILGGVDIPFPKGLVGHSDADVLIHAVIDAILGALAKGDIGQHFPDTDERYRDIDSRILLREITDLMDNTGYEIGNLDATICAEKPKLQTYLKKMQENLASDLHTDLWNVSLKATTEEGLGITGRGKAVTATAVVLLKTL
ncbi:MAG: 2-C-methyl-D-erythritol 2,4-cyclodiphosphate synthase [Candidatus Cloacimonetes bacterium]|nr:2-C-methyl-D-erythritol 2,4-cyclodiphosphate synthase [Candidatus Cloacimonadota bacterium]